MDWTFLLVVGDELLSNELDEGQNGQTVEKVNKKSVKMTKDPSIGGPLGGLCNIFFPIDIIKYLYNISIQNGILSERG